EDRAGIIEVAGVRVVVKQRERPALVVDVVHTGKAAEPFVVLAGRCVEEVVPSIPERLRIPVHLCADASGEIEADDSLIRVASTGRLTGFTGRAALLACEPEHADAHGSDVETDAAEDRFA